MQEVHMGECGNRQGKKRLLQQLLNLRYFWPTMKHDTAKHVKTCDTCQVYRSLIWPFHTWGLDLIGPINPPSNGYIWILVATKYFIEWVEAVSLKKAIGPTIANFIHERIICRFGILIRSLVIMALLLSTRISVNCLTIATSSIESLLLTIPKAMAKRRRLIKYC